MESSAIAVPGRDCSVIPVLGDGNCLFNAMAVGRVLLLDHRRQNAEVSQSPQLHPTMEESARFGAQCRASYLTWLRRALDNNLSVPGWPPLAVAVEAATGMSPATYLEAMEQPPTAANRRTWGGYFEAACLAQRWQCQVLFFGAHREGWQFLVDAGQPHRMHRHHGVIPLAWTGGHFDLLRFGEGGLPAAVVACLPKVNEASTTHASQVTPR